MMFGLSYATLMRALLRLSLHVEILASRRDTYDVILFTESPLMIALIALSLLLAAYVHVAFLLILIMNVLNNYCMLLMILYGA
jgi:hypothetical protein